MRLDDQRPSENIEDRRGQRGGGRGGGAGGLRLRGRGGLGLGGLVIIVIIGLFLGINPLQMLGLVSGGGLGSGGGAPQEAGEIGTPSDPSGEFSARVLGSTETVWSELFQQRALPEMTGAYPAPRLVLFDGSTSTACGLGETAAGPFYCPGDRQVYIDLAFFKELSARFKAPGDFAEAYVIAHEVGHHIQTVTGIADQVSAARARGGARGSDGPQVRLELQADCFAGVWGYHAAQAGQIEPTDPEEALTAASAIGDDTLQRKATGRVVPDSFTHGSSEQRVRWFQRGFQSGDPAICDTFSAEAL